MSLHIRQFAETDRQALRELFLASRRATFTWLNTEAFAAADFDHATMQFYLRQGWQVLSNEIGADGPYALLELNAPE